MKKLTGRSLAIGWLNIIMVAHLLGGFAVSWCTQSGVFSSYHEQVLSAFNLIQSTQAAELHEWWLNLFGATFQAFSAVSLLLIYVAKQRANAVVWGLFALTILGWAVQDVTISARIQFTLHYWVDAIAVLILVPPMLYLAYKDFNHE